MRRVPRPVRRASALLMASAGISTRSVGTVLPPATVEAFQKHLGVTVDRFEPSETSTDDILGGRALRRDASAAHVITDPSADEPASA